MIRAKFKVTHLTQDYYNLAARNIRLAPVYDPTIPEDRRFAEATPSGEMTIYVNNPAVVAELQLGRQFYLDFTPVEEEAKQ